jgi:membrane protein YqaA with SNARE-associated domain
MSVVSPNSDDSSRAIVAPSLIAAAWGFAEATLFFIVPDVLLTWLALQSQRLAWIATAAAAAGALVGGSLMYAWGAHDTDRAVATLDRVPAIGPDMIASVERSLRRHGAAAMFAGPISGTPYKLYAVQSGAIGVGLPKFLLISIPARVLRFAGLVLLTSFLSRALGGRIGTWGLRGMHVGVWAVFYVWYFATMPS